MSTDVTETPAEPPAGSSPTKTTLSIPWWTRGDTNAFFGLGFNILVNVLTLTGLMIGVVKVPADDVLGTVLPALGVALVLGNLYYTFLARRLASRENRTDVTALPYGPSVPHMFIVVFVVMLPVYLNTKDAMQAWESGLAWAFMIGIIVMIGAFDAPGRADVGGGLDRSAGHGDHPDRVLHRHETAVRHPGRVGRAARRYGDRLDRRLHVRTRRQ
jgi:AGZA family xanthine/uracil permease-like MFS transporter